MFGNKKSTPAKSTRRAKRKPKSPPPLHGAPSRLKLWWWSRQERHRELAVRWAVIAGLSLVVVLTAWRAMVKMENHVLAHQATGPSEFRLRLVNRPTWMPNSLARQLLVELEPETTGLYDPDLPRKVHDLALRSPWIKSVTAVRRVSTDNPTLALIEFRAEYRKPLAYIKTPFGPEFLSADGTQLPRLQVPLYVTRLQRPDGSQRQVCFVDREAIPPRVRAWPIHYIRIRGALETNNPPGPGRRWHGKDIAVGLKMVSLVVNKPYANQITTADVRNYGGRMRQHGEPHLRFLAQVDNGDATDIRFGSFPEDSGYHIVPVERKLAHLNAYFLRHNGRLAGLNDYIDLRYDELHVSIH